LPEVLFGDGPGQAALDEIVGARDIPGSGRVAYRRSRGICASLFIVIQLDRENV